MRKKHVALAAGKLSFSIIRIQSQKKQKECRLNQLLGQTPRTLTRAPTKVPQMAAATAIKMGRVYTFTVLSLSSYIPCHSHAVVLLTALGLSIKPRYKLPKEQE